MIFFCKTSVRYGAALMAASLFLSVSAPAQVFVAPPLKKTGSAYGRNPADAGAAFDSAMNALAQGQYSSAMSTLFPLGNQGDARAQYYLGYLFESGKAGGRDPYAALGWYQKAANQDYLPAVVYMGYAYAVGQGVARDEKQSFKWYTRAAQLGDAGAQNNLAVMLRAGRPYRQDLALAAQWFLQSATQGNVRAQYNLGQMYKAGEGVQKNPAEAARWFAAAAEGGDMYAQTALGEMHRLGDGVEKDAARAADLYRAAALQGYAPAQFQLAILLERGIGGDPAESVDWYTKAAAQGMIPAQVRLGAVFEAGEIVPANLAAAVQQYRLAANNKKGGDPAAMMALGRLSESGRGMRRDPSAAQEWYHKAAALGYGPAMMELARIYRDGIAGEKDLVGAYRWFSAAGAALKGEEKIAAGKARAQVAAMLTPAQLDDARANARDAAAPAAERKSSVRKGKQPPAFEYR